MASTQDDPHEKIHIGQTVETVVVRDFANAILADDGAVRE